MRFAGLATDYDGTLAKDGIVAEETIDALRRLRRTGRRAILVTGRTLGSLRDVFPRLNEFDAIVGENGATLYDPATNSECQLADPPPEALVNLLKQRIPFPIEVGRVILATSHLEKQVVLASIQELGLELQIIFNKGSLMILPSGVNKATGLGAALKSLSLSIHNIAGIGDAENDHAFLSSCEFSAAVANALPTLKEGVQLVTRADHGAGVVELIDEMLEDDLARRERRLGRPILIGHARDGREIKACACGINLVTGSSGGGKSTFTTAFLEALSDAGYQFCAIDPEGDYESFPDAVVLGNADHVPAISEVAKALSTPAQNVILNLLGLDLERRPTMFETLFNFFQQMRATLGRPHCVILDEAHHFVQDGPASPESYLETYSEDPSSGLTLITVKPERLPKTALSRVQLLLIAGDEPSQVLREFCSSAGIPCPDPPAISLAGKELLGMRPPHGSLFTFTGLEPRAARVRHRRKYAEGELAPDRSFYFRGATGKLNLRAYNLITFLNMLSGVDDETWMFHLRSRHYSAWFRNEIKDEGLAQDTAAIENDPAVDAKESREKVSRLIKERYTLAA
ncbi:MAG TPA: HAD hydrolase family protein [Bryobacteraceae bacterium]|nr:HAD hydrolase family protein [Bryobacteraceae bacterium]